MSLWSRIEPTLQEVARQQGQTHLKMLFPQPPRKRLQDVRVPRLGSWAPGDSRVHRPQRCWHSRLENSLWGRGYPRHWRMLSCQSQPPQNMTTKCVLGHYPVSSALGALFPLPTTTLGLEDFEGDEKVWLHKLPPKMEG